MGRTKWQLDPSSYLATIDIRRKLGAPPFWGGAGSPSNTKSPGLRPTCIPSGILMHPCTRLARSVTGQKLGRGSPLLGEGRWVPSNTMSSGTRPTSLPSGILIHPTVWPQYTNITDRQTDRTGQDRQDNFSKLTISASIAKYNVAICGRAINPINPFIGLPPLARP